MNQDVEVVSGPYQGIRGTLISLYEIGPNPLFALESVDGRDYEVRQADLRPVESKPRQLLAD